MVLAYYRLVNQRDRVALGVEQTLQRLKSKPRRRLGDQARDLKALYQRGTHRKWR